MSYPVILPSLDTKVPLVSVGLATHRRVEGIRHALRSLLDQTYQNLEIIVHENPSDVDGIEAVVRDEANGDPRVTFLQHGTNIGAINNFDSLLGAANGPLFMWAGDDDQWDADFVERLVQLHLDCPGIAMAAAGVRITTSNGVVAGTCEGFSRFNRPSDHPTQLAVFLRDPEILGKANCFYGLFRTEALRPVWVLWRDNYTTLYGHDVVLIFAILARHKAAFFDRPLLNKGTPKTKARRRWYPFPDDCVFPARKYPSYHMELCRMAPDERTKALVDAVMKARRRKQILISSWRRPLGALLRHVVHGFQRIRSVGCTTPRSA